MTTTPGELLALAADCDRYAKIIEGITVVANDWKEGDAEQKEPRSTLLKAAAVLRRLAAKPADEEREVLNDTVTREEMLEALRDQRIQLGGMHDKTLAELKRVRQDAGEYMRKQEDEIKQLRAALSTTGAPKP